MSIKAAVINQIIDREGGYVSDPADSGGETMYGITYAVARANGYTGAMQALPRFIAFNIYQARYWDALRLDDVEQLSNDIAVELADTGVNVGAYRAAEFMQRLLNVFNRNGGDYGDIRVDGQIGQKTIAALASYLTRRAQKGEEVMVRALNCLQGAYYVKLAERREKDERFIFGWLLNRVA